MLRVEAVAMHNSSAVQPKDGTKGAAEDAHKLTAITAPAVPRRQTQCAQTGN